MNVVRRENDVEFHIPHGLGILVCWHEVDDQIVLDRKHGVGLEPWVVLGVDLCDDGFVVVVGDHEMDVGGAHWVAIEELEEGSGWACSYAGQ